MTENYITINLEEGMPYVDQAIKKLTYHIKTNKKSGVKAIKIIHGFGSSGTGGRIRVESRAYLARLKGRREITDFIPGEQLSIFDQATRKALDLCPEMRQDRDLDRHNNGVTVIIL